MLDKVRFRRNQFAFLTEIEHWRVKLSDKTVEQLKSLLKLNYMTVTGIKSELVDRAAEAVVKGCVPRCPRCRVPVLRYRDTTGMFYCPGMYSAGVCWVDFQSPV